MLGQQNKQPLPSSKGNRAWQHTNVNDTPLTQESIQGLRQELSRIVKKAADAGASDLHLHAGKIPAMRVDGSVMDIPGETPLTDAGLHLMIQASSDTQERLRPGQGDLDHAMAVEGLGRVRINAFLNRGEAAMVLRIVREKILTLEQLKIHHPGIDAMLKEERGILLVTGPTGSGKTTTLAAMIDQLNRSFPGVIVTVEDPIEVEHPNHLSRVAQREVGRDTKNFASGMRAALRQDPDIILIGEMRDEETVEAAIKAAMTGHLVLSTLHTQDAVRTINRVVDFFPPHAQKGVRLSMAESLVGVVSQRLLPAEGGGRVAVLEILVNTPAVRDAIADGRLEDITELMSRSDIMQGFDDHLIDLICTAKIRYENALGACTSASNMKANLQNLGLTEARLRALDDMTLESRRAELERMLAGTRYEGKQ